VFENAHLCGHAVVHGNAKVLGKASVYEYAQVFGRANVLGDVQIGGTAVVESTEDYIVFKNCWSSGRYLTWTRSNDMWKVGCFYGTGEELIKKAYKDSELSGKCYETIVRSTETINTYINESKGTN
jgi:hypothetical protein